MLVNSENTLLQSGLITICVLSLPPKYAILCAECVNIVQSAILIILKLKVTKSDCLSQKIWLESAFLGFSLIIFLQCCIFDKIQKIIGEIFQP